MSFSKFFAEMLASLLLLPYFAVDRFLRFGRSKNLLGLYSVIIALSAAQVIINQYRSLHLTKPDWVKTGSHNVLINKAISRTVRNKLLNTYNENPPIHSDVIVSQGQNIVNILADIGVNYPQILEIAYHPSIKSKKLFVGQGIRFVYNCDISYVRRPVENQYHSSNANFFPPRYTMQKNCNVIKMSLPVSDDKVIEYNKDANGTSTIQTKEIVTKKSYRVISGRINGSLYGDALKHNVPASIITKALKQYSYILDFQRDIHQNDIFSFVFEEVRSQDGELLRNGELVFADLILRNKKHEIYMFKGNYYNGRGESIKKTLLKTPIDGARITSGFGRRKHPVLGYTREHKGVDFGAPTGTPVYSAGDGIIEFIGVKTGYGKFITVQHNKELKTNYAHLSRFGTISKGSKVSQRQVIGYVGSTGMATGPHLHFEMVIRNQKVNPKSAYFSSDKKLTGIELERFKQLQYNINRILNYENES